MAELISREEAVEAQVPSSMAEGGAESASTARPVSGGGPLELGAITGIHFGETRLEAAVGRHHRGSFELDRWATLELPPGEDLSRVLPELFRGLGLGPHRVATVVPSELLSVRYLRLPSSDPSEIRSMIPHRLAALLPVELDEVAWSCSIVAEHGDGSSTVLVHLARRDQLDAYLAPLRGLSVGVWAAIPEARLLARFLSSVLGESHEERTLLASTGGTHHLLVERKGELLYHRSFAARAERESPQFVSEMLLLSIGEIQGARSEFENQLGRSLPGPIRIVPEIDPAPSLDLLREYAGRLSQKLAAAVVLESAALESSRAPAPFARSLAEIGAFPELSVVPAKEIEALGRREAFRTVLRTALFVALLAGLTVAAAFASLRREEAKTELLRAHVAEAESRVEEIERMREALEAEAAALGTDLELWRVLASVEAALPKSLFIQRLAYQRGDKVQLVGSSAELRTINDFARELEGQPLWKRVDVLRVQRPGRNRDAAYQFEMEGRLDEGAAVSGGAR